MLRQIYTVAKFLGFVPLFVRNKTKNLIWLLSLFVINQCRLLTETLITFEIVNVLKTVTILTWIGFAANVLINFFTSSYLYTAYKKFATWNNFLGYITISKKEKCNILITTLMLTYTLNYIICSVSVLFVRSFDHISIKELCCWISIQISTTLYVLYLYLMENIVKNITRKYEKLHEALNEKAKENCINILQVSSNSQFRKYGIKYQQLYLLVEDCNELFKWPILAVFLIIFLLALDGCIYAFEFKSSWIMYMIYYLIMQGTHLVSHQLTIF